ncbi:hypothetical protein C0J52_08182 [Blattella germanica]|nr:hypothetical protein C0J52_08182 [Blattella germanica]
MDRSPVISLRRQSIITMPLLSPRSSLNILVLEHVHFCGHAEILRSGDCRSSLGSLSIVSEPVRLSCTKLPPNRIGLDLRSNLVSLAIETRKYESLRWVLSAKCLAKLKFSDQINKWQDNIIS